MAWFLPLWFSFYIVAAEEQGVLPEQLSGTIQKRYSERVYGA